MQTIKIIFDQQLPGYIVTMPDFITLKCLFEWKRQFDDLLKEDINNCELALLIDTGKHDFESVECLKFLRDYLSETPFFREKFVTAAFIAPPNYVSPHIVSKVEGYFNEFQKAYDWLRNQCRTNATMGDPSGDSLGRCR